MSPEPRRFGRTPGQSFRAAAILALLGGAAVVGVGRFLTAPRGPLGPAYAATGLPEWLVPGIGAACVALLAVLGLFRSLREAPRFEIGPEGFSVSGTYGSYQVRWENLAAAEATGTGALGLRLRDREALLATHTGTPQQREWLATLEPIGGWDLLFPAADLGRDPETVRREMEAFLHAIHFA